MCGHVLHPLAMDGRWLHSDIYGQRNQGVSNYSDDLPKEGHLQLPQDSDRCRWPSHLHTSHRSGRAGSHIHQCSLHTTHLEGENWWLDMVEVDDHQILCCIRKNRDGK